MFAARHVFVATFVTTLAANAGCALDMEESGMIQQAGACPWELCGVNVGGNYSLSMNGEGLPNHRKIRLASASSPYDQPIRVMTRNSDLAAVVLATGVEMGGQDMVGSEIVMTTEDGATIILTITGRTRNGIESWAFPDEFHPTYNITWRYAGESEAVANPLCGAAPWSDQDLTSPISTDVVILPREAYDWDGSPAAIWPMIHAMVQTG